MGIYYIGVDFGTTNTKVCVREEFEQVATAVPVQATGDGAEVYLLPSTTRTWTDRDPPKVILLSQKEAVRRDHEAMEAAIDVVTRAARAAIDFVKAKTQSDGHRFRINLGYPSVYEAPVGDVGHRYELVGGEVVENLARNRGAESIELGSHQFDERSAALVHLAKSRAELDTGPLFLVDGGGYTLHMTIVRWRAEQDGFDTAGLSVHGTSTRLHGITRVVSGVLNAVEAVRPGATPADASDVIQAALRLAYEAAKFTANAPSGALLPKLLEDQRFIDDVVRRAQASQIACLHSQPEDLAQTELLVETVLREFANFVAAPLVRSAWRDTWGQAWKLSPERKHWSTYPLFMLGGACRAGRGADAHDDPLSASLAEFPRANKAAPFTRVTYPEMDERLWFESSPSPALRQAMPFLFVAAGYTHPEDDWPEGVRATSLHRAPVRPARLDPTDDG